MLLGLALGAVLGAPYGLMLYFLPAMSRLAWYGSLTLGESMATGAAIGLCYGGAAGLAGAITLAVDARLARDAKARTRVAVRAAAAVAAAIGVVVAFLLIAIVAELARRGVDMSDLSLLVLVGVPALLAAFVAAVVAQFVFSPVAQGA